MSKNDLITLEDVILEMQPFSDELKVWCRKHPEFFAGLKCLNYKRFVTFQAIYTSHPNKKPEDEVIGMIVVDYTTTPFTIKQDFIVNKDSKSKEFILYTRHRKGSAGRYVKDINEFYSAYGREGLYADTHHLTFEGLDPRLKERAERAIKMAGNLKRLGVRNPSQEELQGILMAVKLEKAK